MGRGKAPELTEFPFPRHFTALELAGRGTAGSVQGRVWPANSTALSRAVGRGDLDLRAFKYNHLLTMWPWRWLGARP